MEATTLAVCVDCYFAADGHDVAAFPPPLGLLTGQGYPACTDEGEGRFANSPCPGCGSLLAGQRLKIALLSNAPESDMEATVNLLSQQMMRMREEMLEMSDNREELRRQTHRLGVFLANKSSGLSKAEAVALGRALMWSEASALDITTTNLEAKDV